VHFDVVFSNLDIYIEGMKTTVSLTLFSFAVAFAIGLVVAAFRVSPVPPLRLAGVTYVEVFRNIPLPVLFVIFFFGFPKIGVRYEPFLSAVIVLSVYTGAFLAETVRAGINTVAKGQAEAARAIGLTFPQTLRIVILPQALRTVVAPVGNIFIALIKNSAIALTISVAELTNVAEQLNTDTARPVEVFLGAAVAYLVLTLPAGVAFGAIERRVGIKR
jgi:glutamate transport system permease protein